MSWRWSGSPTEAKPRQDLRHVGPALETKGGPRADPAEPLQVTPSRRKVQRKHPAKPTSDFSNPQVSQRGRQHHLKVLGGGYSEISIM